MRAKLNLDWNDPKQRRAYKREWMRRARGSQQKNFRVRARGPRLAIFPGIFVGSCYRSLVKRYLGDLPS